jgi:hypothetical protein
VIESYLNQSASKVVLSNHTLFDGTTSASITLTGNKPSVTFKCSITLSPVTGHTDCVGDVYINSEKISFLQATTKTTTTNLTALPTITTSNLDCHIKITCIDTGNAPIQDENLTSIAIRLEKYDSGYYDSTGLWKKTDTQILSQTLLSIGDKVRYGTTDYTIRKVEDNPDLGGITEFYSYLAN